MPFAVHTTNSRENLSWIPCCVWSRDSMDTISVKLQYNVNLERDSIVSALIKKIHAGKTFIRVAPNTFALKNSSEIVDEGGAL